MRPIRTFAIRNRNMSDEQKEQFKKLMNLYGLEVTQTFFDFKKVFVKDLPIVLEIGFGDGNNLLYQAKEHKDFNYLGIEVYQSGVFNLLKGIAKEHIDNIKIIQHDATEIIKQLIPSQSISRIQVYFPDPWPKKRHHKRRLINPTFLQDSNKILKKNGILHIATDWEDYAEHVLLCLENDINFKPVDDTIDSSYQLNRTETKYEKRGRKLDHKIWDFHYYKV